MKVTTYQSPAGAKLSVCGLCEKRYRENGTWPRDRVGGEFCAVSHGLHEGICTAPIHRHWDADAENRGAASFQQ